jgi:hypothetical protein
MMKSLQAALALCTLPGSRKITPRAALQSTRKVSKKIVT